ncbi:MAG: 50S ribosomal protein L2 [Candidatus Harrisonbacteria bacterium]|nr:50S ribosomal protein L2 [Candidatus Harrisonbacteria bacterium]
MKQYNPTTPSRRQMTTVDYAALTTDSPFKSLTTRLKTHAGRNHKGRITVRHQGGGNKKLYRAVDFMQEKKNIPARVETIEYDPYRTAFIALVLYSDGERRYILAAKDMQVGDAIVVAESAPLKTGNRLMLKHIPIGSFVHNVEMRPGGGGKIARSAGGYAEVMGQSDGYTDLRLASKEVRKLPWNGYASLGQLSNIDWNLVNIGKAGRSRWLGIRPTVRGTVMNPVDHPYGGGEGRQPRGTKRPKTRWGKVTGGRKTRKPKKWSSQFIMQRRPKVR